MFPLRNCAVASPASATRAWMGRVMGRSCMPGNVSGYRLLNGGRCKALLPETGRMSYNTQARQFLCQCGAMVAQQFCKLWVAGSSPVTGSRKQQAGGAQSPAFFVAPCGSRGAGSCGLPGYGLRGAVGPGMARLAGPAGAGDARAGAVSSQPAMRQRCR